MGKFRHLTIGLILIATFSVLCALAQSNLTQIRDTIYNSNGTPFSGTLTITWNGSSTGLGGNVSPFSTSARIGPPSAGARNPASILSSDVFPAPFAPSSDNALPGSTRKLSPRNAPRYGSCARLGAIWPNTVPSANNIL